MKVQVSSSPFQVGMEGRHIYIHFKTKSVNRKNNMSDCTFKYNLPSLGNSEIT